MAAVDDELSSSAALGASANISANEAYYKVRDDAIVVAIWTSILMYALVSNIIVILGILRNASMRKVRHWRLVHEKTCANRRPATGLSCRWRCATSPWPSYR